MKFNLKTLLSVLALIPQLIELVDATVKSVEAALVGVPGASKFAAAEAKLNTLLAAAIKDAEVLSAVNAVLAPMINAAVAAFNAAGFFKRSTPAAVAP